jgi:sugar lactone lactonase YvrE
MSDLEHILPIQNELGEGPVWSTDEQLLYWVDIHKGNYHRLNPLTGEHSVVNVGVPIGVLALRQSGGLILAVADGFALWDEQKRELRYLAKPDADKPLNRFNDGAVDSAGRFWAGTMNRNEDGSLDGTLYRLDPDGSVHAMETNIGISNGIGWSPDDTIMYYIDTTPRTIYAYDFDAASGTISNRRIFAHDPADPSSPDGLAVDSEGYIWAAHWGGAKVVRYDPDGKVERVIQVPALQPTSCVFGGPALDELYITSARIGHTVEQQQLYPYSGDLFRLKTGIKGLEQFKFAG